MGSFLRRIALVGFAQDQYFSCEVVELRCLKLDAPLSEKLRKKNKKTKQNVSFVPIDFFPKCVQRLPWDDSEKLLHHFFLGARLFFCCCCSSESSSADFTKHLKLATIRLQSTSLYR